MIIFLDIDGVLNDFSKTPDDILAINHPVNPGTLCKENLKHFLSFLEAINNDYLIYINSTWMYYHPDEVIRSAFANNGFDGNKIFFGKKVPPKRSTSLSRVLNNPEYSKCWTINNFVTSNPNLKRRIISLDDLSLGKAHKNYFKDTFDKIEFYQTNKLTGFNESTSKSILNKNIKR